MQILNFEIPLLDLYINHFLNEVESILRLGLVKKLSSQIGQCKCLKRKTIIQSANQQKPYSQRTIFYRTSSIRLQSQSKSDTR